MSQSLMSRRDRLGVSESASPFLVDVFGFGFAWQDTARDPAAPRAPPILEAFVLGLLGC
jgi:hypothetical protein